MFDFTGAHILSADQFDRNSIDHVLKTAKNLEKYADEKRSTDLLNGKVMAALFFEPSTRTRLSFEVAMHRLGGQIITVSGTNTSSLKKGETLEDMGSVISEYADVVAMRHPETGSVQKLASTSTIPVLNGGDGSGQHPTQGLLDLYTIQSECGEIDGRTITLMGDLKYGRTVHSLAQYLTHFSVKLKFFTPEKLAMPDAIIKDLRNNNIEVQICENIESAIAGSDVIYNTRIQKERFDLEAEYNECRGQCILTKALIEANQPNAVIMHPLPRVDEITADVDDLKGAAYFRQARNGIKVRMALLALVLGKI